MRKLTINTFLTLDGVMQAPGGPEEDPSGGFKHGGWSVKYWDQSMMQQMSEFMGRRADLLLGRKTYEIFAAHWPHSDEPGAAELNNATKYVASKTLKGVDWKNSQLITGDVAEEVAKLKRGDGPGIQVHGSANLIQTLLKHELIDEFSIFIFPLVLGTGKRLFAEGTVPEGLKLIDSTTSGTGVTMARFARLGAEAIRYGSFAKEQPTEEEVARREQVAVESAKR
ncbi:MAG: dihydrofolate reductase family protein [Gemmatimonadaceae bacterium]